MLERTDYQFFVPQSVKSAFDESDAYFPTPIQKFQFFDKYSRFNYDLNRRETWVETVDRTMNFLHDLAKDRLPTSTYDRIRKAILEIAQCLQCDYLQWLVRQLTVII